MPVLRSFLRVLVLLILGFLHVQARLLLSFNLNSSVEQAHDFNFFLHFYGSLNVVILRMRVNTQIRQMF